MKLMLSRQSASRVPSRRQQAGAAIIEFALVALLFFTLLLGIMEFGRWLFTLNAASEATRWGARLAVVCGSPADKIKTHVGVMIRSGGTLDISYPLSSCTTDCMVTVKLVGASGAPDSHAQFTPLIPFLGGSWDIPQFSTSLPREAMGSEGSTSPTNSVCPLA